MVANCQILLHTSTFVAFCSRFQQCLIVRFILAIRCMQFALEEGIAARDRREELLKIADPTWVPVDREKIMDERVWKIYVFGGLSDTS
jgi:hypothetical protein